VNVEPCKNMYKSLNLNWTPSMIIADNGHVRRYVFVYSSVFFDETDCLCIDAYFNFYTLHC